jgi:hypothetical protein
MWNRRKAVIASVAVTLAMALTAGLVLTSGRGTSCEADCQLQAASPFTTASGQPMTFAPGPVWVVLAAR